MIEQSRNAARLLFHVYALGRQGKPASEALAVALSETNKAPAIIRGAMKGELKKAFAKQIQAEGG